MIICIMGGSIRNGNIVTPHPNKDFKEWGVNEILKSMDIEECFDDWKKVMLRSIMIDKITGHTVRHIQ